MAKRGRPPKLTPARQDEFCELLHRGVSRNAAARSLGCSPSTVNRTMKVDRRFRVAVLRTERDCERRRLARLTILSSLFVNAGAEQLTDIRKRRVKSTEKSRHVSNELDLVLRKLVVAFLKNPPDAE